MSLCCPKCKGLGVVDPLGYAVNILNAKVCPECNGAGGDAAFVAHRERVRNRPPFGALFMDFAQALSLRSTCRRLQVGCVIASVDHQRVLAIGFNGSARGGPNDCDSEEPGKCGCIHAEQNAVIKCADHAVTKVVYCTNLPCVMCAKSLLNLGGVERVVYRHDYRIRDGIDWLRRGGVMVEHVSLEATSSDAPR